MNSRKQLKIAIDVIGGQTKLSSALDGVSQARISTWLNRDRKAPAQYCIAIEEATGGEVTRYQLRPDVFGEAPPPVDES